MDSSQLSDFQQRVMETMKASQERNDPPLVMTMEIRKCAEDSGLGFPSPELGQLLISNLCFNNNNATLWKFVEQAINSGLVYSPQLLALLTSRVIPYRRSQPEAYRLYLELLCRYGLSFSTECANPCKEKVIKSVDEALHLSHTYRINITQLGDVMVLFLFNVIMSLIDGTLEDWGFQPASFDKNSSAYTGFGIHDMDIDAKGNPNDKRNEHRELLRRMNTFRAVEVAGQLLENRKAIFLIRLVHLNMPEKFADLVQRLQFLESHKAKSPNLNSAAHAIERLSASIQKALEWEFQVSNQQIVRVLTDNGSCRSSSYNSYGAGQAPCWLPFDIYMENVMDGKQLPATSAIGILTELIRTLQVLNHASWQETFLALWVSALRLVQRERDPLEGPVPHLDARLCFLLSITPLAIIRVVEEDCQTSSPCVSEPLRSTRIHSEPGSGEKGSSLRRCGLVSSLQVLGQFSGLLLPPTLVIAAANAAAAKASSFVSNLKNRSDGFSLASHGDASTKSGNLRHLIVEACIARKLIDTSAYFWPGYISTSFASPSDTSVAQRSPWSAFMEGAQLTGSLKAALIVTPATSLGELEKLYHMALNGSDEEKTTAARILCGASLTRGWNIQEHVVKFAIKLLSPPPSPEFSGPGSHLIAHMSMLHVILFGLSSVDNVHILSLYGVIPEVAASLMPLCETFGSLCPTQDCKASNSDEASAYVVFSCAFLFLLRLCKFYRPPYEHSRGQGCPTGSEVTLEYLLLLHNSHSVSNNQATEKTSKVSNSLGSSTGQSVFIDSFPKLRAWYCQNQACIASPLSGLCNGHPVHQVVNKIVKLFFWRNNKSGNTIGNTSSSSSNSLNGSPINSGEDGHQKPMLPAWEILEAIPFVLEAVLTACAHGRISSRDLITGLRDLVDFLPASLASIISYFSAEVTRGIWKPVPMNGTDWPSPAANLISFEAEMREIHASAGVNMPSCYAGGIAPVMLPLPMAALSSLTITFKLDKNMEYIHAVSGPALESCASGCPGFSMPIIGALWAQKVRRWHDFIVFSCCRSTFRQDQEAVAQLLKGCFASFLGSHNISNPEITTRGGVTSFLGVSKSPTGAYLPSPGFFYIRMCRAIHNPEIVNGMVLKLVAQWAQKLAMQWTQCHSPRLRSCGTTSLAFSVTRVKEVASLGASLICVTGGVPLVHVLYRETMPTWLLTSRENKPGTLRHVSGTLEGFAMAYTMILSGSSVWGVDAESSTPLFFRRSRVFGPHMDFIAGALEGNISIGCDTITWKAYVSCFLGLVVRYVPAWIPEIKPETLRTLATGLRTWNEGGLALSLLERGGMASMGSAAELIL